MIGMSLDRSTDKLCSPDKGRGFPDTFSLSSCFFIVFFGHLILIHPESEIRKS